MSTHRNLRENMANFVAITKGFGANKSVGVMCDGQVVFSKYIGLSDQTGCEVSSDYWFERDLLKIKQVHEFQMQNDKLVPVDIGSCKRCFYDCCCVTTDKLISTTITTWRCDSLGLNQIQFEADQTFLQWQNQSTPER